MGGEEGDGKLNARKKQGAEENTPGEEESGREKTQNLRRPKINTERGKRWSRKDSREEEATYKKEREGGKREASL